MKGWLKVFGQEDPGPLGWAPNLPLSGKLEGGLSGIKPTSLRMKNNPRKH